MNEISSGVRIDAHVVCPGIIEIEMLSVPRDQRLKGVGTRAYRDWEARLSPDITLVRIWVADTDGRGRPFRFWASLGFDSRYSVDEWSEMSYELAGWMWKGVNGFPTPKPILLYDDSDDE